MVCDSLYLSVDSAYLFEDDDIIQDLVYQVRTIGDDLVTVDVNTDKNPEAVEDVENIRKYSISV